MSHIKTVIPVMTTAVRNCSKRPFKVSIEGNIGSGKSTCIKFFEKFDNVETHAEPINEWRDVSGNNLLGLLYKDMNKWTFAFQHYVHLSRLKIQTSPPKHTGITVKMFERSVQNSRHCFVQNAKKQNFLEDTEFQVLNTWFDYTEKNLDINLDLILYLRTTPQVVWDRMVRRGRAEESEIPLDYLEQEVDDFYKDVTIKRSRLTTDKKDRENAERSITKEIKVHDSYEAWLSRSNDVGCEVVTIDADRGLSDVIDDLTRYSYKVLGGNHTN